MRKWIALLLALVMALSLVACGEKAPASDDGATVPEVTEDKEVTLRYATHHSSTSETGKTLQAWLDDMTAKSNGSIKVDPYWQGSLVAPINAYAETSAGVTDLMTQNPGMETDHFILETAITYMYCGQLPYAEQVAVAHELWEQVPDWQAEFSDVEVLGFGAAGNNFCLLTTTPIKSLADLKGKDIRVMEQWAFDLFLELGANPIKMPLSEMYEGLQKGVIDGVLLTKGHYVAENLTEYVSYITDIGITPAPCVWTYINKDCFNGLSANQKEIIKSCGTASEQALIAAADDQCANSEKVAKENGVEIFTFSAEDVATITKIAQENAKKQVAALDAAGYDGTGIYNTLQSLIEAHK